MLRLPTFRVEHPSTVAAALALLEEHGEDAMLLAGGTDLVPNMKHELFTPSVVVSLAGIAELSGIHREEDGTLVIGAMTSLADVAADERVVADAPVLSQAAGLISGPQLRRMGTLGGNVMLDTRCQWYNQTHFWRQALGYCLKKDGTVCHVVAGGQKCVAAASNDGAPALMSLDARLVFHGPAGRRVLVIDDLWRNDGIHNKTVRGEILTEIRVPAPRPGTRSAYGKLRDRGSIDFPLFGVAVRLELDARGETVEDAAVCTVALQARPGRIKRAGELLRGARLDDEAFTEAAQRVAERAHRECRPLDNIPGDAAWRHAMVPVYVRRTLAAAARGEGPVHHL